MHNIKKILSRFMFIIALGALPFFAADTLSAVDNSTPANTQIAYHSYGVGGGYHEGWGGGHSQNNWGVHRGNWDHNYGWGNNYYYGGYGGYPYYNYDYGNPGYYYNNSPFYDSGSALYYELGGG